MKGLITISSILVMTLLSSASSIEVNNDNQKITYVKIKPLVKTERLELRPSDGFNHRSSRIENIPLQIRGASVSKSANTFNPEGPPVEPVRTPRSADSPLIDNTPDYLDAENESGVKFEASEPDDAGPDGASNIPSVERRLDDPYLKNFNYIKPKTFLTKKYFGAANTDPGYRKYLESRRFRSRCRCERIWNCPKLQISVPRCPEEYFLCCF